MTTLDGTNRVRCSMCDELYDPNGERAAIHDHPEPQGGIERDLWLSSGLSWEDYSTEPVVAYKLTRADCPGWMHCGIRPTEVADAIQNELDSHEGLSAEECGEMTLVAYQTTRAQIQKLPEFGGW